ncbi:hypothetical protein B296_00039283 [Ensete ventricosum]|uniref:Uncharacterized protein n=1 Tax=Ensete ventricosum TaxID=4639 RepID=A0A426ZU47_ENSVE|nr:hypothetical protein B296_00039283 [Ensete ventricosum]
MEIANARLLRFDEAMWLLSPSFATVRCRHLPPSSSSSSCAASDQSVLLNNISSRRIVWKSQKEQAIGNESSPFRPRLPFSSVAFRPLPAAVSYSATDSPSLSGTVVPPPCASISQWNLDRRHILLLNFTACAVRSEQAFKKAAESLEKLLDVTAEELPDTMAAVRLSGMEISDLTMELRDIGQEISQGVRSSTRAVRVAEDRLRRLTTMTPMGCNCAGENQPEQ